ncbi:MAG TPA: DUF928 domain-containing protein [Nostocaceae cyanobacterium]|nr:DUF928 domain-containing protein [Nostocaceae cyanobacterium]
MSFPTTPPTFKTSSKDMGAIVPRSSENNLSKIPPDLTISDRPIFFIHIPRTSATQVQFVLRNEQYDVLVKEDINLKITNTDAIIAYTLPESFPGLEVGKKYIWRFFIMCNPDDNSGNPRFSGWVKKVEPLIEVRERLTQAKTNLERFNILVKNDYWFDMINTLYELRYANPGNYDLTKTWRNVLKSVGLESLAKQPIIKVKGVPLKDEF